MVFESLVADLLNKFLGDYVENLDSSQLKLGIWGGDVVLQNLDLKESALDDLELPVKVKAGHLGKLTLKIPWKNLYKEPVIATIDGVYALAVPNYAIKYDAVKEEKEKQEAKQKRLRQIEEAKMLEAEKNKPKEAKKDSFAEKMATQIIKNLQIHIKNIHVRYEDSYTNPKQPFAIGVTLQELLFQTTDENWKPCILKEAVTQIYKLVRLDSLAVYWNSKEKCMDGMERGKILESLKATIGTKDKKTDNQYLIKPLSFVSHLRLNTKPEEANFTIPKIYLTVVFDDIGVVLSKLQYNDVLEMLEALERMSLRGLYRKFRPGIEFKGHAKRWWHFARDCVMESVKRRRKMWSWSHIRRHRDTMKRYREAYTRKLEHKKTPSEVQKIIDECEEILDVFSITIMRQQAEVEAAKRGAKKQKEKEEKGWFGGWFGGGKKKDKGETTVEEIKDQFEELYTAEEKQKLYAAIDYEENEADPSLPKEYVAVKVVMKLSNMGFTLVDNSKQNPQLVKVVLQEMFASVSQRPAASAVALEAKMDKFLVRGVTQGGHIPKLVVSQNKQENETLSLLDIQVETNPLDGQCDTRVRLNSRPLQIVYDAVTINHLAEFFKPPDEVYLHQLSQAALAKLEDIKEQSATGLQHAIDIRKYTDIAIDIKSSYVIIPYGGLYKTNSKILVLDLGNLKVSSQKNEGGNQVKGQLDSVEEIMARAYDKFNINLESIQVLYSLPNQDWQKARQQSSSDMHVIEPIKIKLCLQKCMFSNDARMAKIKVSGELPILSVAVSDKRLQSLLSLVDSIPLPESAPPPKEDEYLKSSSDVQIIDMNSNELTTLAIGEGGEEVEETKKKKKDTTNYTDLELTFEVKQVMLKLSQVLGSEEVPVLKLVVESLGTQVKVCTYTLSVESYLGGVYLQYLKEKPCDQLLKQLTELKVMNDGPLINLVNTPVADEESFRLLTVQYLKADPKGPEFNTTYKKTEQSISVNFSVLEVLLHQEAILDLISLGKSLQPSQKPEPKDSTASQVHADGKKEGADKKEAPAVKKRKKKGDPDVVEVAIKAELSEFGVAICNSKTLITDARIKGAVASVMVQNDKTVVSTVLQAITVFNPDPDTIYPKIMEIQGSSVLDLQLTVYNDATEGDNYSNMDCVDTSVILRLGCIRVVYLNSFVMNLLSFLDNFQDAKDRMSEASEVVAEYSKDAVQKFQETAPRVKLDILMKAPVVEVPQNSRSRAIVLADFGELKILSHFQLAGKTSEAGVPAVLEKMDIKLTNLQLQRAVKSCKEDLGGQCLLVEPVTIAITVTRNLAASWYTEVPEVDVSGAMEAVMATMSQGDFTMIMTLLNENLGEGQPENKGQIQKPAGTAKDTSKTGADRESSSTTVTSDKVTTKVKASFEMKSLTAALYLGDNKLEGGSTVKRDPSKCLGKVEVLTIAVDAEVMSDTSIVTKVILQDTIVDDTRPQKEGGVTRMIERISAAQRNGQELTSNMIDVDFRQDNAQNKNVDVKISSIYICVCLDFLLSLSEVFKMPETDTTKPAITAKEEKPKGAKKEEQVPVEGSMVVKVTMDKPEIVLIEDQMNFESNALKLETAVMFRMRMSESGMEMSAEVGDLQVSSCVFNKRNVPGSLILCPCEISFYSKQPINQGAHMDLSTTELVVNISPASIRTFSAIVATLTAKPEEGTGTKKEKIPKDLWKTQSLKGSKFWFLQIEEATDGDDVGSPVDLLPVAEAEKTRSELLIAKIPSLVVKLEGGVGKRTVPLLILESSLSAEVKDWSCGLCVESSLFLEVAYYNENLTVWEPLIEPITDPNTGKRRMWSLNTDVKINEDALPEEDEGDMVDGETEVINKPLPKMAIKLQSQDALQVVITKTSLEVLTNLGKSFDEAYKGIEPLEKKGMVIAPYVINNHTGFEMVMKLDNTFELPEDATDKRTVVMSPERQLQLFNKKVAHLSRKASVIKATQEGEEKKVIFQIEQFNVTKTMTIKRAEKRLYHIGKKTDNDMWAVVMCTEAHIGQREVTLRSIVQMKNHLEIPMEIYYSDKKELCGVVSPGETLDLPLHCVYTAGGNFFFRPAHTESYQISSECVGWRAASNLGVKVITCANRQQEPTFYMNVSAEEESIYFEEGDSLMPKCYTFHLKPTVVLHNLFPFPIKYCLEGMGTAEELEKGDFKPLPYACVGRSVLEIILPEYQGKQWDAKKTIQADFPELSMWTFTSYTGAQKKEIDLGLHCKKLSGSLDLSFYCPYWMINKTGKTLLYKSSDDNIQYEHPYDVKDVVLFSFRQKTFMSSKKKVCVTIGDTEWSDKFSLDVVGSSGTVQCKSSDRIFEVGLKIELTHNGLTKICTFTPYYMLLNMSEFSILFSETASQQQWMEVKAGECLPYWPEKTSKNMSMKAKVKDTDVGTTDFLFNKEHTTLMRLDNEFGGINVECRVTELSVVTTLNLYKHGMATVMIVNGTESEKVTFHQVGLDTKHEVPAGQYLMYTWDKPTGEREIKWSCGKQKDEKNTLIKDGFGDFFLNCDSKVYWVSFLDGMQRVLFFTEDIALNVNAQQAGEVERIEQEITVGIQGLGLSLINDLTQREVAFLGITSSGIIWEEKRKRYKALSCKATQQLEEAYQRYLLEIEAGHKPPAKLNVDKMEVSFGDMMMFKPNTRKIQRSFRDGIWLQYQTSPHQVRLHAMVNKLQLDNQAPGAVFPTVISGVPLPKSVAAESVPKPFAEASILIRQHEHSQMKQFKYFKVLIQEMAAKLDQGFLNNIIDLFTSDKELTRDQEVTLLKKDYDTVDLKLIDVVGLSLAEEQKNFFDYLHFSPIKVHLSFSMQGGEKGKAMALHANIINVFLQSVGVVLTDVQDVIFKLGYFQREHVFLNQSELTSEMTRHFANQAIKQMYVLVLGLDVLGNPFGLLRGTAEGIKDLFYEPYQGAIQGPEEFAEGLALGVKSLLGHAVGGAAGAVSRITGTVGKGLAVLTLDDDYQKRRREALNKRPATAGEGFARGGKNLVMGVFDGVTGIVRKPIEGARSEGVEGFFKGVGKGLIGVVTRPTSGVIDFASSSFEGIKRIADMAEEIKRLRPPRHFHSDRIIRPYNLQESEGYAILSDTEKGKFLPTDHYYAHVVTSRDGRSVLIVTDKRVMLSHRGEIFGQWDADWTYTWMEMKEPPKRTSKGIEIHLKEKEKKKFLFGSSTAKKEVPIADPKSADYIVKSINEVMSKMK